jgi:hypothetical protein
MENLVRKYLNSRKNQGVPVLFCGGSKGPVVYIGEEDGESRFITEPISGVVFEEVFETTNLSFQDESIRFPQGMRMTKIHTPKKNRREYTHLHKLISEEGIYR